MRHQNRLLCLAILLFTSMVWGDENSEVRGSKNDVEIAKVEREYLAAKSYYKTLLNRTEALEQTLDGFREDGTSLENLKNSGEQIALLIHQIEQLNEDLVSFYTRTKVASSEVKVTEEAQVSTPKETPVSPRADPLVSNRNKVYETPSTDHQSDTVNSARKDYFSDFIRTDSDTENEKERLRVLKASFSENFYSLWAAKLLEHFDYFMAPRFETVEQEIIKGAVEQAEIMRNRKEFPKAIESLEDLDPNCASLILDSIEGFRSLTFEPKDIIIPILQNNSLSNYHPFIPQFNESTGEISYKRLADRDEQFREDLFNEWLWEARNATDIAFPDNGMVWCNCTLVMMAGWTSGEIMHGRRFNKIRDAAKDLCPESFNQLSN